MDNLPKIPPEWRISGMTAPLVEVPINITLTEQLEFSPDLGTEVEEAGFFAQAARQPIAFSVRSLFRRLGRPQAEAIKLYRRFELWLIPHRVSITRRQGLAEPTSIGIEVNYQDEGMTCSIISLFPSFQFVEHGSIGASASFSGRMSATGELLPQKSTPESAFQNIDVAGLTFSTDAKADVSGDVALNVRSRVVTPVISATGIGSSRCEWRLDKRDEPLFGKDIETWAVIALPKNLESIAYDVRFYLITRTLFVPTRRQSDWVTIKCALEH
jgi:hypothetical protein